VNEEYKYRLQSAYLYDSSDHQTTTLPFQATYYTTAHPTTYLFDSSCTSHSTPPHSASSPSPTPQPPRSSLSTSPSQPSTPMSRTTPLFNAGSSRHPSSLAPSRALLPQSSHWETSATQDMSSRHLDLWAVRITTHLGTSESCHFLSPFTMQVQQID